MQYFFVLIICTITTCIIISDNQKIVTASTISANRIKRQQKYTTKFDNIDVDSILRSRRLLLSYVNCLLEKGPCTPDGRELKKLLPEALTTDCLKCSDIQKKQAGRVLEVLLKSYRDYFDKLVAKYDPDGNFQKRYEIDQDYDYSNLDTAK